MSDKEFLSLVIENHNKWMDSEIEELKRIHNDLKSKVVKPVPTLLGHLPPITVDEGVSLMKTLNTMRALKPNGKRKRTGPVPRNFRRHMESNAKLEATGGRV